MVFKVSTCNRIFSLVLTVVACDGRSIPKVDHATYEIEHTHSSPEQDLSIPDRTHVTYTCDRGYYLEDPRNKTIGCKWAKTDFRSGTSQLIKKAVWGSAEGINCKKGMKQS